MDGRASDLNPARAIGKIDPCLLRDGRGLIERHIAELFERLARCRASSKRSRGPGVRWLSQSAGRGPRGQHGNFRSIASARRELADQRCQIGQIVRFRSDHRLVDDGFVEHHHAHGNACAVPAKRAGDAHIEPQAGIAQRAGEARSIESFRHDRDEPCASLRESERAAKMAQRRCRTGPAFATARKRRIHEDDGWRPVGQEMFDDLTVVSGHCCVGKQMGK